MGRESCVTLKQRADFPPAGDAAFAGELAQSRLQEKDGDPAAHEEDDVGDEERSLMRTKRERKSSIIFLHRICSLQIFHYHFLFKGLHRQGGLPPPFL